jgi:hypothetical protein
MFNQKEYDRKWHKENYQKTKEHQKEKSRLYRIQHKEHYREYLKKYYQEHKKKANEYGKIFAKEHRANLKFSILAIYSRGQPKCTCCGETYIEFLSIDHINNDAPKQKKEFKLQGHPYSYLYTWLIKNNFPEGFQVLCMNCNFAKGKYGYCPHNDTK